MTHDQCELLEFIAKIKQIPFKSVATPWGFLVFPGLSGRGFHEYEEALGALRAEFPGEEQSSMPRSSPIEVPAGEEFWSEKSCEGNRVVARRKFSS